ncbi:MAG: UDP-N-acetylmuramoyl-L-alanyl-D-glutamate--2,6-diaminopimelate ligase [Treponema sp.]|jgi:UDP-N-acetylmuramoyl-L-alanyl-D-glutamate--2,6-diaminopimelate ligase|nr:UDP-N-acetylmuramoyl-L-alanyl-D-glutamate--2,6-diaminopimelate ligase [Treponema sp.]
MERPLPEFFTEQVAWEADLIEERGREGAGPLISGLEYDSRRVKPGNIYFALPGLHTDGHRFVPDALDRGAAAIIHQETLPKYRKGIRYMRVRDSRFAMSPVAAAFYGYPSRKLILIGVTGTEGKSTTVYLIYQLLVLAGKRAGFISTVQYGDGSREAWNPEHQTTPEAVAIHRQLAEMVANGAEYGVVESSSHGLSPRTNRLGDVAFDVAVMTNVTHEHLEFHGSWEQYRDDKANLFRALDRFDHTKDAWLKRALEPDVETFIPPSFGVVNADDPSAVFFASATQHKTYTFSVRSNAADLSLRIIESGMTGNWYETLIRETGEILDIRDRLPGAFNAGNVLASLLVVSKLLSIPVRDLVPLAARLRPVRGRMTAIQKGQPFDVFVDYAHTPSSFETVFPPFRERLRKTGGRLISLFGSAGERDTTKRPEQGRIAGLWSDIVILTDEDPRGEDPMDILEEIARGCAANLKLRRGKELFLIPDRKAAIRKAFSLARPGDKVLLLGKGHENSIIYAAETLPYDEIAEAEKALAEMGWAGG